MRFRTLWALPAAALALGGLTACQTNVGTAATVSGHRITESDVDDLVSVTGPSAGAGQSAPPKTQVLQLLVEEQVFEHTLAADPAGVPSAGTLASYHDAAVSLLLQTQLAGSALDKQLKSALTAGGINPKFAATFLRVQELEYAIIKRHNLSQLPGLVALVKKAHVSVRVNPRYGKWVPSQLGIDSAGSLPSYLTVQSTSSAATSPPPG